MRSITRYALALALVAGGSTLTFGAAPQGLRADAGITVFEDVNYGGRKATFVRDVPDLRSSGLDNKVSSLRIGNGEFWEVCDGRDYGGRCQVFADDQPDLRDYKWNDTIRSLRQVRGGGRRSDLPGRVTFTPLELFAGTNYTGQRVAVTEPTDNLKDLDFNDRAVSVRVPRGQSWEICVNADFDDCRLVTEDVPNLAAIGLARLMSSARPHVEGRGDRGRGGPPRTVPHIVLYDSPNFRGRSVTVETTETSLGFFRTLAGSAEIFGGRWELCDQPRFGGRCATITESVRDLRTLSLRDAVTSVRPR